MKVELRFAEGHPVIGEGPTVLAAIGAIDVQLFTAFGDSLGDDRSFDIQEAIEAITDGRPYRRFDFNTPDHDFTLSLLPEPDTK